MSDFCLMVLVTISDKNCTSLPFGDQITNSSDDVGRGADNNMLTDGGNMQASSNTFHKDTLSNFGLNTE